MRRTLVFVGPTLPAAEVSALLPGAVVRPPAGVGDVLAAIGKRGVARIAIIDGYFERMAAVWHKELLLALEKGIEVWGAGSMGALRAAELAPFGMRGVGAIYEAFVRGAMGKGGALRGGLPPLSADDEVAIAHLPAEAAYRAVSDPLVNLRAGIAKLRAPAAVKARLVELARARHYRERTWAQLETDARAAGISVTVPRVDLKAADARALLLALRKARAAKPRPGAAIRVPRTWALRQLLARER